MRPFATRMKSLVRSLAIEHVEGDTGLFLPSQDGHCVRTAIKATDLQTFVCCESDADLAAKLARRMRKWSQLRRPAANMLLFPHPVSQLDLRLFSLDYIFLDLCGCLDYETATWLRNFNAGGCEIAITLTRNWRTSRFMRAVTGALRDYPDFVDRATRSVTGNFWNAKSADNVDESFPEGHVCAQWAMLHAIFAGTGLEFVSGMLYPGAYRSKIRMTMLRFRVTPQRYGLRGAAEVWDAIERRYQSEYYDSDLVQKAVAKYHAGNWTSLRYYWQRAAPCQRAAISRNVGVNLRDTLSR